MFAGHPRFVANPAAEPLDPYTSGSTETSGRISNKGHPNGENNNGKESKGPLDLNRISTGSESHWGEGDDRWCSDDSDPLRRSQTGRSPWRASQEGRASQRWPGLEHGVSPGQRLASVIKL